MKNKKYLKNVMEIIFQISKKIFLNQMKMNLIKIVKLIYQMKIMKKLIVILLKNLMKMKILTLMEIKKKKTFDI